MDEGEEGWVVEEEASRIQEWKAEMSLPSLPLSTPNSSGKLATHPDEHGVCLFPDVVMTVSQTGQLKTTKI